MPKVDPRFIDDDLDWLGEEIPPDKVKSFIAKGHFIQDPTTGLLQGSEPGPGHGEGEGGSEREGGGKEGGKKESSKVGKSGEKKVKEISDFAKADIAMYYHPRNKKEEEDFIDKWNEKIDRTPEEFKAQYFGNGAVKGTMTVEYDPYGNALTVDSRLKDESGEGDPGKIKSTYYFDEKKVHMDYYRLPKSDQGHGVMKKVMNEQMKIWKDAGIQKVDLYANIDIGGHAWARYGFEPLDNVWPNMSAELEQRIMRLGDGDDGGGPAEAGSWDELSTAYQNRIETSWMRETHQEFLDSEINSWRESGGPLDQAKQDLVGEFNTNESVPWAKDVIDGYLRERSDANVPVPYTTKQILSSISLLYDSNGDGTGDFEVSFNDDKLKEPKGIDTDPTLPGTPKVEPHEHLTETMRSDITIRLERQFEIRADKDADDIEPPDYVGDNVQEFQKEVWDGMDDSEKFAWAERNRSDLVGGTYSSPKGSGLIPTAEQDVLMKAAGSSDPKALWIIADSKYGKDLLIDRLWDGKMDLNDKLAMERFNAYVGKAPKA